MARNRLNLLEIVQEVLSKMNHDVVDAISATPESTQIAKEARDLYYDFMDRDDWPHLINLAPLESVSDTTRPNFLKIPEDVTRVDNVRYEVTTTTDTSRNFRDLIYLAPNEFLDLQYMRRTENSNVITVTNNGVDLFIINDDPPTYWTTFDDEFVVFDSYDVAKDTTLQGSKSLAMMKKIPTWTEEDTFIPDLPDQMFGTFIAELTAAAFTYWKQDISPKDEQRAARGISRLRRGARKTNVREERIDFGRRRSSHHVRSESGERGSIRQSLGQFGQ